MNRLLRFTTALLLLLLLPATASAHGELFTFKGIDGQHLIMVTHNVHDARADVPISYNLRLYDMQGIYVPFQEVTAIIKQGTEQVHAETLPVSKNNDATFTYSYPKEGTYTLVLSFLDNDKQVAGSNFPIIVEEGLKKTWRNPVFNPATASAFLLGAGASTLFLKRKQLKQMVLKKHK